MKSNNTTLVERVVHFQTAVRRKNRSLASNLARTFLPLLEYNKPLESAARKELLGINGIVPKNVDYLLRIFQGEDIESVVNDVPEVWNISPRKSRDYPPRETDEWDGSWDNARRGYEGD